MVVYVYIILCARKYLPVFIYKLRNAAVEILILGI